MQRFLNEGELFEKNQELLGMINVFRGILVQNCKDNEINESVDFKHKKIDNKIICVVLSQVLD